MEEIEYKLKKNNAILTAQTISKLIDIIKSKYIEQRKTSTETNLDIPELKLLKEKCSDNETIVCLTACQGLVHLVEEGFLQVVPTLSDFVAALSSARNCTGISQGIGNLLLYDMKNQLKNAKTYENSFNLTSPQHPMITILRQNNTIWPDIINQVQFLFSHHDQKIAKNSLIALEPVILYILCNPSTEIPERCRTELWSILNHLCSKGQIQELTLEIVPWMQTPGSTFWKSKIFVQLVETAFIQNITHIYIGLLPYLAALTHEIILEGEDPRPCLFTISKIITDCKQLDANNYVLLLLCETITICPAVYLENLIRICSKIVRNGNIHLIVSEMLIASLLLWMTYPASFLNSVLELAHETIQFVRKNNKNTQKVENSLKILSNKWFQATQKSHLRIHQTAQLIRLCSSFQNSTKSLTAWLNRVLISPEHFIEKILLFIYGIFITNFNNPDLSLVAIDILLKVLKFNTELATSVLTLVLYKLSTERNPKIILLLLRSVPEMAVLKENIALILSTLESLENGPKTLQTQSIDLYRRLWGTEVRCYPYLQRVLLQPPKDNGPTVELDIVKAIALKEICCKRPEHHGTEVVSLLSNILNRCTDINGSLASSLALQGITALCKAGIIDVVSTWKALSPKLSKDKRPIVIKSLCELLSEVPSFSPSIENLPEYDRLVTEITNKLWTYILGSDNTMVITAAFNALSHFDIDRMTLKQLPTQIRQNLKLPAQYSKTPLDAARKPEDVLPYIPGECWIQLLQNVKQEAVNPARDFLIKLVKSEIAQYKSGVYTVAKGQGEPLNYHALLPHKSIIRSLTTYVMQKISEKQLDPKRDVTQQCLYILAQEYDKPLPPLNWSFLHELFHWGPEEKKLCIKLAAKQSVTSGSAQRFILNYIAEMKDLSNQEEEIITLYTMMNKLGRSIPPNSLRPFVEITLKYAYDKYKTIKNSEPPLLRTLFNLMKEVFLDTTVPDANRNVLGLIIESLFEKIDSEDAIFNDYVECVVELSQTFIERMTSPTVWWEITDDKLKKAIIIRRKLAERGITDTPLVWFNECIDVVMSHPSQQLFTLRQVYEVLKNYKDEKSAFSWYLEVMGRIQAVMIERSDAQQEIEFFCDVFIIVVITLAGHDCFSYAEDGIIISREMRVSLLPQATLHLLNCDLWKTAVEETIDFFLHMLVTSAVSPVYKNMFRDGLIALKYQKHFKKSSVWMRCLSKIK